MPRRSAPAGTTTGRRRTAAYHETYYAAFVHDAAGNSLSATFPARPLVLLLRRTRLLPLDDRSAGASLGPTRYPPIVLTVRIRGGDESRTRTFESARRGRELARGETSPVHRRRGEAGPGAPADPGSAQFVEVERAPQCDDLKSRGVELLTARWIVPGGSTASFRDPADRSPTSGGCAYVRRCRFPSPPTTAAIDHAGVSRSALRMQDLRNQLVRPRRPRRLRRVRSAGDGGGSS